MAQVASYDSRSGILNTKSCEWALAALRAARRWLPATLYSTGAQRIWARDLTQPPTTPDTSAATIVTGGPFARSRKQEVSSRAVRLSNNWTMNPNLINTATFAYNRYRNPSLSTKSGGGWNTYLGLDKSTSAGHFRDIGFGSAVNGIGTTQMGYSAAGFYVGNTYIASDSILWVKGRHTMKIGGDFWTQQINSHGRKSRK